MIVIVIIVFRGVEDLRTRFHQLGRLSQHLDF